MASLSPYTQPLGVKRAAHLLRRATFGGTKSQIDQFAQLTPAAAVNRLFAVPAEREAPRDPATGASWVNPKPIDVNSGRDELIDQTKVWWIDSFLQSDACIAPKSSFFLHTHFTTISNRLRNAPSIYYQIRLFDQFALGNFKELTKCICLDNAMMRHLDGQLNRKGSPNENYAREFFELYSIGKGPQVGPDDYTTFTEQDVVEAAKVFSGFDIDVEFTNINPELNVSQAIVRTNSQGLASQHDSSTKTLSAAFQGATVSPIEMVGNSATTEAAIDEIHQLVEIVFEQAATAQHICRKLYRFFVYYEISEEVEQNIIVPLAAIMQQNDYELRPVLEALFTSQHFYDEDNTQQEDDHLGAIIKSPLDLIVGIHRFFEVPLPDYQGDLDTFYSTLHHGVLEPLSDQGMYFYEPFEVAGYAAYHQSPAFHRNWISSNYLARRYEYAKKLIEGIRDRDGNELVKLDVMEYVTNPANISDPTNAAQLVRELVDYLLPEEISEERFDFFLKAILLDDLSEINWQFEWQNYESSGDDSAVRVQLEKLFNTILQSPEFQLS
ncbi:DUF1800 domain-containing protein [Tunicatimonas pelagia]|uniref:DUF1800 domain-containing protein n=1 Tax=Tunicatimonas pelagia TaxID=931531 RepID=UPI0026666BE7|nr:DUF1800 family protein [Tunicatimonas pelagia]WKN43275.1 DUF1800 family protein [Tunicatimonas pelagia]